MIAVITGGTRGIGKATAIEFASRGFDVALCGRTEPDVALMSMILCEYGIKDLCMVADITSRGQRADFVDAVFAQFGIPDILVNNVGGGGRWGDVEYPHKEGIGLWLEAYYKNVLVAADMIVEFLPGMMEQKFGRIVNVASIYGREGGGAPWFNAAKAAQISMMKCYAMNPVYARSNITFNSVAPGPILTGGWTDMGREELREECEKRPMGRIGNPVEVANVIVELCSPRFSFVNGACIAIDGGEGRSF